MPSIFDSLADTTEAAAPAKTGSIFDSLEGLQAATAPTTSARPGEIPRDTSLKAPPAASGDASTLGKLVRGQGVLETGADAADIVLGGLPAIILGSIGEVTQRASSLVDGRGYREGAKAGAEFSRSMGEKFGRPIFDNLVATGLLNKETRSVPMQAMDKIGGYLEHAATVVEADTKGVISKEDYLASINGFMAAMGVKGAQAMTQGALNRAKARGTKSAWDTALERMDAEEQLARGSEAEGAAAKLTTPVADAAKIRLMARPEAGATRTREQARKDARAAFSTPEAGDQAGLIDRQAGYREELAAQEAAVRDRFPPSGERTGSRDAVDLTLTGKGTPVTYTDNQLGVVHPSPLGTGKRLDVVPRPPLETALEKVRGGRLFDMTMEERLAVKNSVDITDPKVITAAAVGATGLGLAMAYEPSAEEAALAIGAGALLRRGGVGETVRELAARPHTTPIGAILEPSAYTTSTLEILANRSPGKFEFKKAEIEQLLKRDGVTKHERDLLTEALASQPGDTITAKELVFGVRMAAKDFELTPEKSDRWADHGLNRIDRKIDKGLESLDDAPEGTPEELRTQLAEYERDFPEMQRRAQAGPNAIFDDYPYSSRQAAQVVSEFQRQIAQLNGAIRAASVEKPPDAGPPITRFYKLPEGVDLGPLESAIKNVPDGHIYEPNSFGHTRSFEEGGIRHVVELQNNQAQYAEKAVRALPKPEERAALERELATYDRLALVTEDTHGIVNASRFLIKDYVKALDSLESAYKPDVWPDVKLRLGWGIDQATQFTYKGLKPETIDHFNKLSEAGDFDKIFDYTKNALKTAGRQIDQSHLSLLSSALEEALHQEVGRLDSHRAELKAKLSGRGAQEAYDRISPMLKDWHKRLVREELADAARNLEPSVRFATADTVAKVEGWRSLREVHEANAQNYRRGSDEWNRHMELAEKAGDKLLDEHQGIYDRYSRDVEKFLRQLGGKPYTDSAGHTWLEVPLGEQQKALPGGGARTQIGGVDPALAKAVGLVGGSAALAAWLSRDKDKVKHAGMTALLTGLGLLAHSRVPAVAKMVTDTVDGVQNLVGNLSTDKAVSAPLLRRLTSHAEEEMRGVHDSGKRIAPFLEIVDRLPQAVRKDLDAALSNGRTSDIVAAVGKAATPGLLKAWNEVQAELKSLGNQLIAVKGLKELRPDYFPRIVKDLPGLMNAIGKEFSTPLQQALEVAERKAGGFLDEAGRAQVVNTFIEKNLRASTVGGKPSFFKRRTLGDVTVDLAPYYVEPSQALPLYIGSAVRAIEKAKFFGKELVRDDGGRPNLEASIGNIVAREIEAGNITPENFTRLTELLRARFGPAYQSPARGLQSLSQLTNIALLGNVFSGLMNVADVGAIAAQHGVLPLVAAVTKMVRGTAKLKAADVGMAEAIGAEFVYGTRDPIKLRIPLTERTVQVSLAKALDKTFKLSGFKALDTVMKEVNLNAAMEKYSRLARTKSGEVRILRQYSDYFTTDMPQLLADLRAGAKTKLTTELAFRELSDAQPTTKIEMPKFYLDHPNLRFGYALKSFMIKQMNFVKKRGIDEMRKGNVVEGGGFIVRYALMAGAAGATMDWIVKSLLGRDADLDWKSIPLNALKNLGLSEYVIDKARQGKGKEAILAATVPPADPILNIVTADPQAVRYFPLVGRLVYDRFMDGAEKANAAKKLAEKKKAADARRTPEERRALEQRALERRKELVRER